MPTYSITHRQVTDDHLVIQTLESTEIGTGQSVTVAGISGLNGTYTVLDVPIFLFLGDDEQGDYIFDEEVILLNQLLMRKVGADIARGPVQGGTLTFTPTCTWAVAADVVEWLGISSATANDTAFITTAVNAANQYAYRRRREAGYFDSLTTVPGSDVKLGTVMYAGTLYRERGSVDSFASFEQMGTPIPFGSQAQINKLLGINRSQVA